MCVGNEQDVTHTWTRPCTAERQAWRVRVAADFMHEELSGYYHFDDRAPLWCRRFSVRLWQSERANVCCCLLGYRWGSNGTLSLLILVPGGKIQVNNVTGKSLRELVIVLPLLTTGLIRCPRGIKLAAKRWAVFSSHSLVKEGHSFKFSGSGNPTYSIFFFLTRWKAWALATYLLTDT